MNRNRATLVSLVVAILVGIGALLCSFASHLAVLGGVSALPRSLVVQDPLGWALRPGVPPLAILGMLLVLVLLVGLTWLFVRLVVQAALPGRGAAVFFGTWGALIVAAMVAGIVRAVVMMVTLRIPSDNTELYLAQFQQFSFIAATWALMWGWIVALVAALIHRSASGRSAAPQGGYPQPAQAPQAAQAPQQFGQPQQYAPQQHAPQQYAPQPTHPEQPQYQPPQQVAPPQQHPGHTP